MKPYIEQMTNDEIEAFLRVRREDEACARAARIMDDEYFAADYEDYRMECGTDRMEAME